jgi:hypothetical protein
VVLEFNRIFGPNAATQICDALDAGGLLEAGYTLEVRTGAAND